MSNNLVSDPMPSMQMAQLQPIVSKGDPMSQQQEISNNHVGLLRAGSGEPRSQSLPISAMQSDRVEAHRSNMGPQQLSTTPKRKAPTELSSSGFASNKRVAQMGNRPWLQQVSNMSNKGSAQMQSPGPRQLAPTSKRKTQTESIPSKSGTPRSSNPKSQNTQIKQSSKVQTESSESVRSKMRESLAAALALVSKQDKPLPSNNDSMNSAPGTQDKLESSSQWAGSALASEDTAPEKRQDVSQSFHSSFVAAGSVDHVNGHKQEGTTSNEDFSEKFKDFEAEPTNVSNNENILGSMQGLNCYQQDFQSSYTLTTDDVPFSDSFFVNDDFLQGNGLSWVISDMVGMENQRESQNIIEQRPEPGDIGGGCGEAAPSPELLASWIEAELFKLFGGANKKYKEKGRSLLFNLKDRNNPELRERVMSGEIPPERLCSMTAEELASKELSQWRIAKAEELAQMVVLPDSDADMRRLVKKTHKGEFQVEVDHGDNVPVEEVSGGTTTVARHQTIKKDVEASSSSKPVVTKGNEKADGERSNLQRRNALSITISSNDGTDPMQGLMTDDALKDPDFLPPIVSLDEFMGSLHSEPLFENLPVESGKATPGSNKDDSVVGSKSKSSDLTPSEQGDVTSDKFEKLQSASVNSDVEEGKRVNAESGAISSDTRCNGSQVDMMMSDGHSMERSTDDRKPSSSGTELRTSHFHAEERSGNNNAHSKTVVPPMGECIWEGVIQLDISTTQSVVSIFKSGEKTSAKEWPGFLEIKGRVRLNAFEKFLQQLPQSRSRAIMVSHFVSRVSSPNQHSILREVAESYVSDERVGFAEPMAGVELYFCPPHNKTVEMLSKILPKEQIEAVNSIENGLIGVIVWRKFNLTSISPTGSSHHKHTSSSSIRQHLSRRDQYTNVNANPSHTAVPSMGYSNTETRGDDNDDDDDNVPPGFGPQGARAEDDLPEFNFMAGSSTSPHIVQRPMGPGMVPLQQAPSRPVHQHVRDLILKYGQNMSNVTSSANWQDKLGGTIQSWNDDDDDIPEWNPQNSQNQNQFPPQLAMHHPNFHVRSHIIMNQQFSGSPHQQPQPIMPAQYLQPPMNVTHHGQQNFGPQWAPPPTQGNNLQPSGGQHYVQGTAWPQNVPRSRGF